jgi:hypothetical protein
MGIRKTIQRWNTEADARIAGEDAACEWYRQGDGTPPDESILESLAEELAPSSYEWAFMEGFEERWDEGVEASQMNVWERFWKSKSPL